MGMSATDELRRLLDERGVEWDGTSAGPGAITFWHDNNCCAFDGSGLDKLTVHWRCTPEQAIAATLGNDGVERSNDGVDDCYLMYNGKKFPVEFDYGFTGIMPVAIEVGGLRFLIEVPNGE